MQLRQQLSKLMFCVRYSPLLVQTLSQLSPLSQLTARNDAASKALKSNEALVSKGLVDLQTPQLPTSSKPSP
jgi:hypothetical protein